MEQPPNRSKWLQDISVSLLLVAAITWIFDRPYSTEFLNFIRYLLLVPGSYVMSLFYDPWWVFHSDMMIVKIINGLVLGLLMLGIVRVTRELILRYGSARS